MRQNAKSSFQAWFSFTEMEFTKKEFIDCDLLTGVETAFVNQPYPIRSVVSGKYKLIHYLYPSILLPQRGF